MLRKGFCMCLFENFWTFAYLVIKQSIFDAKFNIWDIANIFCGESSTFWRNFHIQYCAFVMFTMWCLNIMLILKYTYLTYSEAVLKVVNTQNILPDEHICLGLNNALWHTIRRGVCIMNCVCLCVQGHWVDT